MEEQEKLKVLWWANAPHCPTGYGVGTKGVVYRIKDRYDIRVLCFYGLQGRMCIFDDIVHYPQLMSVLGDWEAKLISARWKPHFLVTFFDIWIAEIRDYQGGSFFGSIHDRWVPWAPVDHEPSPLFINKQAQKAYHVVTMSRFGKEEFDKGGIENTVIPLGADTSIFKPSENKREDKQWLIDHSVPLRHEKALEWSPDDFIVGLNAAPKDPIRKNFDGMYQAFSIFLDQNPDARKDARFYNHTWTNYPHGGWPLGYLADDWKITEFCRVTEPYYMYCGFSEPYMSLMTRSWDVFMNLARREGFGIPIIEACACGIPPIVTNFTSMPELAEGHGWIIDYNHVERTNLLSYGAIPDPFEAAEALGEAYNSPDKVKRLGEKARQFSYDYDWRVIAELWAHLLDKLGEDVLWSPLEERRIK